MKYLLLVASLGGGMPEPPDAGPYPSLEDCNKAMSAYIDIHAVEIAQKSGQGVVLKCTPVRRRDDSYVR